MKELCRRICPKELAKILSPLLVAKNFGRGWKMDNEAIERENEEEEEEEEGRGGGRRRRGGGGGGGGGRLNYSMSLINFLLLGVFGVFLMGS